jgi:invasion protein IalB
MQRFRWAAPSLVFLIVAALSDVHAQTTRQSPPAWWKWCGPATAVTENKEGKKERKPVNICATYHHRINGKTLIVSTGLWHIEGQDKWRFFVNMPPNMKVRPGLRVSMFPKHIWDDLQKQRKIESSKKAEGKKLKLGKTSCDATHCFAQMEATPEQISDLQTNGGLVVFATTSTGMPVAIPIPLEDFTHAMAGPPGSPPAAERPILCAGAEWLGCSMKPIHLWGR